MSGIIIQENSGYQNILNQKMFDFGCGITLQMLNISKYFTILLGKKMNGRKIYTITKATHHYWQFLVHSTVSL